MTKKISARAIAGLRRRGKYRVDDNLYLRIGKGGRRSWLYRYQRGGDPHEMGLGAVKWCTLQEAREEADKLRRLHRYEHKDPLQHRRTARALAELDAARSISFEECAARFLKAHENSNWSKTHRRQWRNTLTQHAYPTIGQVPVSAIGKDEVLRCLEPIWHDLPVTAARVRNRIAQILDWAAARDLRTVDNPAKHPKLLPKIKRQVRHLAAVPYTELPALMSELRQQRDIVSAAVQFIALTCSRLTEALGARWNEISGDIWTVPAERMKSGKAHRVPLSRQALEVLQALPRDGDLIFHRPRHPDHRLHHTEPLRLMRRLGRTETVHGMRSAFRDFASERTRFPYETCERVLAHRFGSEAARAYDRTDRLEERRKLMQTRATFLNTPPTEAARGEVVPLRA